MMFRFVLFKSVHVCIHVCMGGSSEKPEEGIGSLRAGVRGGCKLTNVGADT